MTDEYLVTAITQTEIQWYIDNENGHFYSVLNGWTIKVIGDGSFTELTYQKGPKFGRIAAGARLRFYNINNPELKRLMQLLLVKIKEKVFKNSLRKDVAKRQSEFIRAEFINDMMGWNKPT